MFQYFQQTDGGGPAYRQIADHVLNMIASEHLKVGDRLPPQREIARRTGVNLTTVTRAFAVLHEHGVVDSRPGKGTRITLPAAYPSERSGVTNVSAQLCDLSINRPATDAYLRAVRSILPELPGDENFAAIQDYHAPEGHHAIRRAMAGWMAPATGHADPERIAVVNGAQHGLACTLSALARPGRAMLADAITFQGFISLCAMHGVSLKSVEMDDEGMIPDAFDAACVRYVPTAVFLMPTYHNPTTQTLSAERRAALAQVARKHDVTIIEADPYRPLVKNPPPAIAASDPDITVHVTSLSKCAAAGIRLGAVSAPPPILRDIRAFLQINCWSTSFGMGLIVARLTDRGRLKAIIAEETAELAARNAILANILPARHLHSQPTAPHAWLTLSEPWRGSSFTRVARSEGVCILPGYAFTVDRDNSNIHAIRLNVNAARSREDLRKSALILDGLLQDGFRKGSLNA